MLLKVYRFYFGKEFFIRIIERYTYNIAIIGGDRGSGSMRPVYNRRIFSKLLLIAAIILIQLTVVSVSVSAREAVEIVDVEVDEIYAKRVAPGDPATYIWTLENMDGDGLKYNITLQYNITIDMSNSNSRWTAALAPGSQISLISYKDTQTVTLTVTPPSGADKGSTNVTLTFTARNTDGDIVQTPEKRYTLTSLEPLTKEEEKRVMGWFDNPLPSPLDN